MSSYARSKEQVVEVETDRVLTLPGRDVTRRADREDFLVRAVVTILDAPDQTLPDLVLNRRGDFEEVRLRAQRSQSGANTLRVLEVLESQGRAQRLGPVVHDVARPAPPRGARVAARPRGRERRLVLLPAVVDVRADRQLLDPGVVGDEVEHRAGVAVLMGLLWAGDPVEAQREGLARRHAHRPHDQRGLVLRRGGAPADGRARREREPR